MATTDYLGLYVLPSSEEGTKIARDFMRDLAGDSGTSNMQLIDAAFQTHETGDTAHPNMHWLTSSDPESTTPIVIDGGE